MCYKGSQGHPSSLGFKKHVFVKTNYVRLLNNVHLLWGCYTDCMLVLVLIHTVLFRNEKE